MMMMMMISHTDFWESSTFLSRSSFFRVLRALLSDMHPTFRDKIVLSYSRVIGYATLDDGVAKMSQNLWLNPRTLKTTVETLQNSEKRKQYSSMTDILSAVAGLGDPHFESSAEVPVMAEIFQSC